MEDILKGFKKINSNLVIQTKSIDLIAAFKKQLKMNREDNKEKRLVKI